MAQNAKRKSDAGAAAFFVETLCQDADTLLRFGFALSLSEDLGSRLVFKTYESFVEKLPELLHQDHASIRLKLLRRVWELHHETNQEGESSDNLLFPLLKPLDLETRACFFLVDAVGLSIDEARQITQMEENETRRHLCAARKRLLDFRFD